MIKATIHWATFIINPSQPRPFAVECGCIMNVKEATKASFEITNCQDIADAAKKIIEFCKKDNVIFHKKFTLLYPVYLDAFGTEYEAAMNEIAESVAKEAKNQKWKFNRIGGLTGQSEGQFFREKKKRVVKKIIPPITQNMIFGTAKTNTTDSDRQLLKNHSFTITIMSIVEDDVVMKYHVLESEEKFDSDYVKYSIETEDTQQWKGRIVSNKKDDCVKINLIEPYKLSVYLNTELLNFYTTCV